MNILEGQRLVTLLHIHIYTTVIDQRDWGILSSMRCAMQQCGWLMESRMADTRDTGKHGKKPPCLLLRPHPPSLPPSLPPPLLHPYSPSSFLSSLPPSSLSTGHWKPTQSILIWTPSPVAITTTSPTNTLTSALAATTSMLPFELCVCVCVCVCHFVGMFFFFPLLRLGRHSKSVNMTTSRCPYCLRYAPVEKGSHMYVLIVSNSC